MALPPSVPLPAALQGLLWIARPIQYMRWCERHYGRAFRVTIPPFTAVLFSDRQAIRTIFAARPEDMHAGLFNSVLRPIIGSASVFLLDGREHIRERKLLLPAFHGNRMRLYGETMAEVTRRSVATWPHGVAFSLYPHALEITLQIILRTVFGAEGAQLHALRAAVKRALGPWSSRLALIPLIAMAARPERQQRAPWKWLRRHVPRMDALLYGQIAQLHGWTAVILLSVTFVSLMIVAIREVRKRNARRNRPTPPPLPQPQGVSQ